MLFQHFSSSLNTETSLLTLYGRTEECSVAIHTNISPTLVCGSDPRYLLQKRDYQKIQNIHCICGNDITKWGERIFHKITFKDVKTFYWIRKRLRNRIELFNTQVSLETQWFLNKRLRQCSTFQISPVRYGGKITHCEQEYFLARDSEIRMVDKYIEPVVLSYDLECLSSDGGFPDPVKDPIICIGCWEGTSGVCFCWKDTPEHPSFETEKDMIHAFLQYVRQLSPDFLTGYNIDRFDNTYLEERCKQLRIPWKWSRLRGYNSKVKHVTTQSNQKGTQESWRLDMPGVCVIDAYLLMRGQHNLARYSLESVAQHFLGTGKDDMPYKQIPIKFQNPEGRKEIAEYCIKDAKLVIDLIVHLKKVINLVQMSKVTGCSPTDIVQRGQGIRTITLMLEYCYEDNIFIPNSSKSSDGFKGAVVLDPSSGFYTDPVICVDFASLYPSIMRAMNMCYSTIVSNEEIEANGWVEGKDVRTVPDYEWTDGRLKIVHNPDNVSFLTKDTRPGVLPRILAKLYSQRKEVKKQMKAAYGTPEEAVLNGVQMAIKVVMNSIYGFTGAKKGYLPEPRIAESVTLYGRGCTLKCKDYVDANYEGCEVIYGDSVSADTPLFVQIDGVFDICSISELTDHYSVYGDKESCELLNVRVWSDTGWTKVHRVIRHKVNKKMYRVATEHSLVDCTEDHSLLKSDKTPVKPTECTRDLLEVEYPGIEENYSALTYWQAFEWGKSLGLRKCSYGVHYIDWKIPNFILLGPSRVAFGFFEGLCSVGKDKERARKLMRSKEEILRYQFLLHRLGMHTGLGTHKSGFRVSFLTSAPKTKFSCKELPQKDQYVYDLTTDSSHFHVGPGKLVVHNTDSCFIRLGPTFCKGDTEAELIAEAERKGEIMANEITEKLYLKPILLEYEMVLLKMCLLKRKKYFGIKIEPGKKPKHYMKGIECVRRDFCGMVVKTQREMINLIFQDKIEEAVSYVQGIMKKLYAGEIPLDDLLMTKKLPQAVEDYKTTAPHVELAKRLKGRYQAGERVEYFIRAGREDLNQRAVTREELVNHRLDYDYYAERQLKKPIQRIMDLIVNRQVFKRMAVTAPIRANSGGLTAFVNIGERRKKKARVTTAVAAPKPTMQQKILSFFG